MDEGVMDEGVMDEGVMTLTRAAQGRRESRGGGDSGKEHPKFLHLINYL